MINCSIPFLVGKLISIYTEFIVSVVALTTMSITTATTTTTTTTTFVLPHSPFASSYSIVEFVPYLALWL